MDKMIRTLTVHRFSQDITVEVVSKVWGLWSITAAIDEDGNPISLSEAEWEDVLQRIQAGHDETGW